MVVSGGSETCEVIIYRQGLGYLINEDFERKNERDFVNALSKSKVYLRSILEF